MAVVEKNITKEIIDSFSSSSFEHGLEYRKQAIAALHQVGLPTKKTEEYRFTPITAILEKSFSWSPNPTQPSINSIDKFLIPNLQANLLVFVNGKFSNELSKVKKEDQFEIAPLTDQLVQSNPEIDLYFEKNVLARDPFSLLNAAFCQDGIFIRVPANTTIERPFHILHICDSSIDQTIAHARVIAVLEANSKATIVESFHKVGSHSCFNTLVEELIVKENSNLHYIKIQNDAEAHQVANTFVHQDSNSRVDTFTLSLDGKIVRNNLTIEVDGEKCESHFHGLYLLKDNSIIDNHTVVDHKQPNSFSNEMYKGVIRDNAKGVFNGKIYVRPHAQKTNAFQSNRNILLGDTATINTKPQLEIWADDVKCSHGCTTGQLDNEALFYLRSRGIPAPDAKALLLHAFASETYSYIENEVVKAHIEELISERLGFN